MNYVVGEPLMRMFREFPGEETFTMTGRMIDTGAAEAFMEAGEEATTVMAAAISMTGTGPNTVWLIGLSTG